MLTEEDLQAAVRRAWNEAIEAAALEAEHWQKISRHDHKCGEYIAGAVRTLRREGSIAPPAPSSPCAPAAHPMTDTTASLVEALRRIKYHSTTLSDAQVIALQALDAHRHRTEASASHCAPAEPAAEPEPECERCWLPPSAHTLTHWCDNQSFVYPTIPPAPAEPAAQGGGMTAQRAAYFLRRFKHEEKMLGPNEQAALDFAIASLATPAPASPCASTSVAAVAGELSPVDWAASQHYRREGLATAEEVSAVAFRRHGVFSVNALSLENWVDIVNCVLASRAAVAREPVAERDAVSVCASIMALMDDYIAHPTSANRHAIRSALMALAAPQPSPGAQGSEVVAWANFRHSPPSYVPFRTEAEAAASVKQSRIAATQEGPYSVVPLYPPRAPACGLSEEQERKPLMDEIWRDIESALKDAIESHYSPDLDELDCQRLLDLMRAHGIGLTHNP